jgi:hypothetical protein
LKNQPSGSKLAPNIWRIFPSPSVRGRAREGEIPGYANVGESAPSASSASAFALRFRRFHRTSSTDAEARI